jgi:phenylpropionate dioxygenase-like ring-hydroxylating dioxygenase large terminal subunit
MPAWPAWKPRYRAPGTWRNQFQRYPLADLRIGSSISYEVEANWKVLCENYNECYHFRPVHPDYDPSDAVDFWHLVNRQDSNIKFLICTIVDQIL